LPSHSHDDAFHEIQLNGKQLVFLFMAATVVSVVIFLCGVLVGRGVRAEVGAQSAAAALDEEPTASAIEPAPATPGTPMSTAAPRVPSEAPAPEPSGSVPSDDLRPDTAPRPEAGAASAPARRERAEDSPSVPPPAPAPAETRLEAPPQPAPKPVPTTAAVAPRPATAAGQGWVVQVAALNERGEADVIAKRLIAKGYDAFVVTPTSGNPAVYRVRVGTFGTKREADAVGAKLKKEEKVDPWVTR
jgi:cell division septation protein DedD